VTTSFFAKICGSGPRRSPGLPFARNCLQDL
jgi:hypothetical protein